jgi:hypothetical protein
MTTFAAFSPLIVLGTVTQVYGIATAIPLARSGALVFYAPFTRRRFYLLMGWAPLTFVMLALVVNVRYLAYFVVAGVAGIAGELLLSVLWRAFFREPIWTYTYGAKASGFTSTLNFLPWAVGGLLFQVVGRLVSPEHVAPLRPMLVSTAAFALGLAIAWTIRTLTRPLDGAFSKMGLALFCLPIVMTGIALALLCDPVYLVLMAVFAVLGSMTEYGYGRSMSYLFEQGLWSYNHGKIDDGHTSYVTLPLWALGGLYFHFLAACLGL